MKQITGTLLLFAWSLSLACNKKNDQQNDQQQESNIVKGRVVDTQGQPIANAIVEVNHAQLFNTVASGTTDANGNYRIQLSRPGSWYVRAHFDKVFDNRTYRFDLHPSMPGAFSTQDGAVCNFSWKLTGQRTGLFGDEGTYGAVLFVSWDDLRTDVSNVEITLTPQGKLIDGSNGSVIRRRVVRLNNWNGSDGLDDVPMGIYKAEARLINGAPLRIRINVSGEVLSNSVTFPFVPTQVNPANHIMDLAVLE